MYISFLAHGQSSVSDVEKETLLHSVDVQSNGSQGNPPHPDVKQSKRPQGNPPHNDVKQSKGSFESSNVSCCPSRLY